MKDLRELDEYRVDMSSIYGKTDPRVFGAFIIKRRSKPELRIIATNSDGWDHVSVSLEHRIPRWEEMEFVKRLFFKDEEVAVEYHVPTNEHINVHPNVLHLWRPHDRVIPMPPPIMV